MKTLIKVAESQRKYKWYHPLTRNPRPRNLDELNKIQDRTKAGVVAGALTGGAYGALMGSAGFEGKGGGLNNTITGAFAGTIVGGTLGATGGGIAANRAILKARDRQGQYDPNRKEEEAMIEKYYRDAKNPLDAVDLHSFQIGTR